MKKDNKFGYIFWVLCSFSTTFCTTNFKHTSITKAFQVHGVYEIQKRAGHSKVSTTVVYDRSQLISRPIGVEEKCQSPVMDWHCRFLTNIFND
jgi:hypothetical protein